METKTNSIEEKLMQIQAELKVPKNLKSKFGNYMYRNAEQILKAVKPLAAKYGCYLKIEDNIIQLGNRFYVESTVTISDGNNAISSKSYAREAENKTGMDASQITGAATSYARKYALGGLFGIDDGYDADAMDNSKITDTDVEVEQQDDTTKQIYESIEQCTTMKELEAVWNTFKHLQKDKTFISLVRKKQREIQPAK